MHHLVVLFVLVRLVELPRLEVDAMGPSATPGGFGRLAVARCRCYVRGRARIRRPGSACRLGGRTRAVIARREAPRCVGAVAVASERGRTDRASDRRAVG